LQPVSGDVVVFWRGRLSLLGEKLKQNPASESAWFWQVQWDILNHLLHRYAGDEMRESPVLVDAVPFARVASQKGDTRREAAPAVEVSRATAGKKSLRDPAVRRSMLAEITGENQDRYEQQRRLDYEIAEALRAEREKQRERAWLMRALCDVLDAIGVANQLSGQMSNEEMFRVLSKIIVMDEPPQKNQKTIEFWGWEEQLKSWQK
jgi:hypothetical protein